MEVRPINNNLIVCDLDNFHWVHQLSNSAEIINNKAQQCIDVSSNNATVIGVMHEEFKLPELWENNIKEFISLLDKRTFILSLDRTYENYNFNLNCEIIYINYSVSITWFEAIGRKNNVGYKKFWNNTQKKYHFLVGKADKSQRIRLLYKLYKKNLLKNSNWSLIIPSKNLYNDARAMIPEISDTDFKLFVDYCSRIYDTKQISIVNDEIGIHFGTVPKIPYMAFWLVTETTMKDKIKFNTRVSEKLWMPVINHIPFLVAADTGYLIHLENLGINTFSRYFKNANYNNLTGVDNKLNAIVENVNDWYKNNIPDKYSKEIKKDTEHNFQIMKDIAEKEIKNLIQLNKRFNLINYGPYDLISFYQYSYKNEWDMFYTNIKDKSWPPCVYEDEFMYLPEYIQEECINKFGYNPKQPFRPLMSY